MQRSRPWPWTYRNSFQHLTDEFGEDLLQSAAIWMTLRESKASFAIEGEADRASRIERFAEVMARRTGHGDNPFSDTALARLQSEILGRRTTLTHFGLRQSPVFVGETVRYQDIVHYIAARWHGTGAGDSSRISGHHRRFRRAPKLRSRAG